MLTGSDGEKLLVTSVKVGGKSLPAANLLGESSEAGAAKKEAPKVDEAAARAAIEAVWKDILGVETVRRIIRRALLRFCDWVIGSLAVEA